MMGQEMEEFQRGALTATARNGSSPNEDHLRTALVVWSGNCGEVSQWPAAHKKGTHDLETSEGGASQGLDTERRRAGKGKGKGTFVLDLEKT
jgi:hypothetical protein